MLLDLQRCKAYKIFSGKEVRELTITYSIGFARLTPKRTNAERIGTKGRLGVRYQSSEALGRSTRSILHLSSIALSFSLQTRYCAAESYKDLL